MNGETNNSPSENAENQHLSSESAGSAGNAPEAGLFDKMQSIAANAYAAAGGAVSRTAEKIVTGAKKKIRIIKRGRGKPTADGRPGKNDVWEYVEDKQEAAVENPPAGAAVASEPSIAAQLEAMRPGFMRRTVANITEAVFAVPNYLLGKLIEKKKGRQFADETTKRISPKPDEIDDLALYTDLLLKKYNLEAKYPLELAAASTFISIGSRYATVAVEYLKKDDLPKVEGGTNGN